MGFLLPSRGCLMLCEQRLASQVPHVVVAALLVPSELLWSGNIQDIQVQN